MNTERDLYGNQMRTHSVLEEFQRYKLAKWRYDGGMERVAKRNGRRSGTGAEIGIDSGDTLPVIDLLSH